VDEAQAAIVATAKALADAGEIVIAGSGEDDELVY
jgi:flagellar motor switch protein FliG